MDANTLQTLNGMFKETYAQKMNELIPDGVKVINKISFLPKEKMPGNLFHQPCILGLEHGVTYASSNEDYFALNNAVAGTIKDATIKGAPMVLRSILGYTSASRAAQGNAQSFMDATKFLVANMLRSMAKKLEIEMLYGQVGYGIVNAIDHGTFVVTIETAEWAPGIWAGSENMPIDFVTGAGASHGSGVVKSVDLAARTITLVADAAAVVAGDVIYPKGAYTKSFKGIHSVLKTSGDLFGIDTNDYSLFKGNEYSAGNAALSFQKLSLAATRAVEKGLEGKLYCLVNPRTWANLMNDQAALRKYDYSYSSEQGTMGAKAIKFFSQNGELEIEPSIYVKEGYAYMLAVDEWVRVGSTDLTFKRPSQGEEFFRDMENAAGYELRAFTDQAIFCQAPGKNVLITNIVNAN